MAPNHEYEDALLSVQGQIGTITLNRPRSLNAFSHRLLVDLTAGLRELNDHPETVFTVITGEGRFFSAGADVIQNSFPDLNGHSPAIKKIMLSSYFATHVEVVRSLIEHRKVLVVAMNGPAVGGGAGWFAGSADILLASTSTYIQIPFSSLGLIPEFGSALNFTQSIGLHRANELLLFGRKISSQELLQWGLVNKIFPHENFGVDVKKYLQEILDVNDGKSMIEGKRLTTEHLREGRLVAVAKAADALAERFVEGVPFERFARKREELVKKREQGKI